MKQLVHSCEEHIVVGLNTVAFYGVGNSVRELLPSISAVDRLDQPAGGGGGGGNNSSKNNNNPLEVQAVAVTVVKKYETDCTFQDEIWCAVARYDKSLSLYRIRSDDDDVASGTATTPQRSLEQVVVHKTLKRVSTLCFATVYGATKQNNITVVVTGDLAGDAFAFPLTRTETETKADDENDDETTSNRRLLLGHTASMLTSVHVVPLGAASTTTNSGERQPQRILTSDRDEKIRVSSFPSTHCIEGFLLGHEAFVSSVAVVPSTALPGLCVSVGGDETLRLWDFVACRELARATLVTAIGGCDGPILGEPNISEPTTPLDGVFTPVPTKVSVSPDGLLIVVILDHSPTLEFWKLHSTAAAHDNGSIGKDDPKGTFALEYAGRFKCQAQPLGITFLTSNELLVVLREPSYVQAIQVTHENSSNVSFTLVEQHPFCAGLQQAVLDATIAMPASLLERDDRGSLKMEKMNELRSGATLKPWNNAVRKEIDKERVKRVRKRQRDGVDTEEAEKDESPDT